MVAKLRFEGRTAMRKVVGLSIFLAVTNVQTLSGDRGSIPFRPGVKVFEPTQRAMIAWNGNEEILLLSTDLRASEATKVLEVIPLPSEPVVKKGDVEVFKKATALINEKLRERYLRALTKGGRRQEEGPPAGEVTFHKKIGAHDVSVTRVLKSQGFVEWVEKYLASAGVESPTIPEEMKGVVGEYLQEGFTWFVFDVVSLDEQPKTNEAIQYRFASKSLFYPLKITRTEEGDTSIELLVLTPRLLGDFPGIPIGQVKLPHEPVDITAEELRSLNEEMDALLGHQPNMKLRIWQIKGKLSSFKKDLIAK
jgi:hypothetical protein